MGRIKGIEGSSRSNGFSKKLENLAHVVSLHFMYYNLARIHQTLRVTPAMEVRVSDHVWSLEEIAGLTNYSCGLAVRS